jgi:uncharacterized RDD family membrane protein YckC
MHCKHCGFANGEDDHRCLRCGRRLSGTVIAAPPGYSGANALAPAIMMDGDTEEFSPAKSGAAASTGTVEQPTLFRQLQTPRPSQNVIPFERVLRETANRAGNSGAVNLGFVNPGVVNSGTTRTANELRSPAVQPLAAPPPLQPRVRKTAAAPPFAQNTQGTLDFIPAAPMKGRKLKTEVDAQVFCDLPVATPTHRCVAAAIDGALILIGFGVLMVTFQLVGGSIGTGKMLWMGMAGALGLVAMFYGLVWAIAGRETAGMRFADLYLITFDGFPLDGRSRALRFASTWLSFCSGGIGLLWAVADEENLTWHDHISKTFPTIRETPRTFVKQRR